MKFLCVSSQREQNHERKTRDFWILCAEHEEPFDITSLVKNQYSMCKALQVWRAKLGLSS